MAELGKARLQTWKEVAAFFDKDERTVKRWEAERGLPIHRLPGGARSRIYAEVSELQAWLSGGPGAVADADAADEPGGGPTAAEAPRSGMLRSLALAGVLVGALVLASLGFAAYRTGWLGSSRQADAVAASDQPPSLAAQRLYLAGMDDWSRRTPDSLHRAVEEFSQAIRLSPSYAEAYVGLANCYNLLREFTLMPAGQAYPLAKAAAVHALAINERLASAHAALAFVEAWWDWDLPAARREFQRAIELQSGSDLNHHWYATFLSSRGEFTSALEEFRKAEALNPTSLAIRADHGLVLYQAGRRPEGLAMLLGVEKADPNFLSPHNYLSGIYLAEGREQDFLREAAIAARLTDDRQRMAIIESARAGLARGGRGGMLQAMLGEELRQYQYGALPAYTVADTYALLGDRDRALAYLQTSIERREENAAGVGGDVAFYPMHGLQRYQMLVARIRPAHEPARSL